MASYDRRNSLTIPGAVSELSYFRIGSLWTAGSPEQYPNHEQQTVELDVYRNTCVVYLAYGKTAENKSIIPKWLYPISRCVADGQVAFFPSSGRFGGIIIPCVEIFRFYYFEVSGKFGTRILDALDAGGIYRLAGLGGFFTVVAKLVIKVIERIAWDKDRNPKVFLDQRDRRDQLDFRTRIFKLGRIKELLSSLNGKVDARLTLQKVAIDMA